MEAEDSRLKTNIISGYLSAYIIYICSITLYIYQYRFFRPLEAEFKPEIFPTLRSLPLPPISLSLSQKSGLGSGSTDLRARALYSTSPSCIPSLLALLDTVR